VGSGREWRQVIQLVVKRKDRVADDAMARLQYEFSLDTVTAHHTTTAISAAPVKSDGIFHIWATIPEHYAIGDKLLLTATVETALGAQQFVRRKISYFPKELPPGSRVLIRAWEGDSRKKLHFRGILSEPAADVEEEEGDVEMDEELEDEGLPNDMLEVQGDIGGVDDTVGSAGSTEDGSGGSGASSAAMTAPPTEAKEVFLKDVEKEDGSILCKVILDRGNQGVCHTEGGRSK